MRRIAAIVAALVVLAPVVAVGALGPAPNDPLFKDQWGLTAIGAPQAWSVSTGKGVTIGIVDTGIDLAHEDLSAKVAASTNCIGANGDPTQCHGDGQDDNGHGTHLAGIAAAVTNNGKGIAGTAPDAQLVVAKSLDAQDSGSVPDIAAGVQWVVAHGAKVVLLGFGGPQFTQSAVLGQSLHDAIEAAWSKGAVPVLASGNSTQLGFVGESYGTLDAVVVGATGRDGTVAGYSSPTGTAKWALVAPGGSSDGAPADDIISTYWMSGTSNAYQTMSGTDMAAAFVAGTLALLLAHNMTPATAVARLLATVNTAVSCGPSSSNCHGALNAAGALGALGTATTSTTVGTSVPPPTTLAPSPTTVVRPAPSVPPAPQMRATHPSPPSTSAPKAQPQSAPPASPTLNDTHAVAVAPVISHHSHGSLVWGVVLAALFVIVAAGGVVWMVRASPEPE